MPEAAAKVPVKMIWPVDPFRTMKDPIYGTGEWDRDEIKLVDPPVAAKLLKHVDVYAPATAEEAAATQAEQVDVALDKAKAELDKLNDNATQDLRDSVNKMERDAMLKLADEKYRLRIPKNLSTEAVRQRLIQHIDIAGPV